MAYTTNELIVNSYYESGIVSRDFETPTGNQITAGLSFLNDLLADKTPDSALIPYTDRYSFNAISGTDEYFIPNLIGVETFTFFINSLRYETRNQQRKEFMGSFRPVDVESLPFFWHVERRLNGANLFLYFVPDQNYPLEIWGQFRLASVTQFQDLELTLDRFYINLLRYELATRLCKEYKFSVPPDVEEQLQRYYQTIGSKSNTIDLRNQRFSSLNKGGAINYAYVNVSGGWSPGSGN